MMFLLMMSERKTFFMWQCEFFLPPQVFGTHLTYYIQQNKRTYNRLREEENKEEDKEEEKQQQQQQQHVFALLLLDFDDFNNFQTFLLS